MKTTIIFNHPYEGSFCSAILNSAVTGLKNAGHEIDVMHLDKDKFNPVMTAEDLLAFRNKKSVDKNSIDYIKRISDSEHIVFIFPIWWEMMPSLMKGFIDKVIFPGEFYNYTSSGFGMIPLMKEIKGVTVITTMNTPKIMYKLIYGNAIKKALIKGTLHKAGYKRVKWISFNMVKMSSNKKRVNWLKKTENYFANLK